MFIYTIYVYIVKLFGFSAVTYKRLLQEETVSKNYLEKQWMALLDYNYKAIKHANNKLHYLKKKIIEKLHYTLLKMYKLRLSFSGT